MKVKAGDLTGVAFDWAVALVEKELAELGGQVHVVNGELRVYEDTTDEPWSPLTNWAQGGPIIEWRMVTVGPANCEGYEAYPHPKGNQSYWGNTPLEAAMRCVVATAVGDDTELEIPEHLK